MTARPDKEWTRTYAPWEGDAARLAGDLQRAIAGEVLFDSGSRALYATDASNYRQPPIGVVRPRHKADVVAAVEVCRSHAAPILGRGGGTSLAGQCCNAGVVFDMSRWMNQVIEIDTVGERARVQPGTVLDDLRRRAQAQGLTFGPDPATHDHCTFGGMIGNNSCGVHALWAGRTVDNVHRLEVLTYDGLRMEVGPTPEQELAQIVAGGGRSGEIYAALLALRERCAALVRARFPDIPRRVSGYCLDELLPEKGFQVARSLVGTESTCVLVLEAEVRLLKNPDQRVLMVVGYDDVYHAADHVMEILERQPIGLEGIDHKLYGYQKKKGMHPRDLAELPAGNAWLLVEFGAQEEGEAMGRARELAAHLEGQEHVVAVKIFDDPASEEKVWKVRESGLGATARIPGESDTWPGWEDSAVAPAKLGGYLRDLRSLFDRHGYDAALYGHFGDGCVHCRIDFDLRTARGLLRYRDFVDEAADLVVRYGGSLSGEHGDGQARAELLPKMYGRELCEAFREFKAIWDPANKMNPGKVVAPWPILSNLRLGTGYAPAEPATAFRYPDDDGSFARAALRCVGVGKCRRESSGTMCPSYMVTHEEKHSTRGRARLLFEMLQGDVVRDLWRSKEVKEALDLCLACKGCKGDCPVNVDMATYKAEFLSHHWRGRLRPRAAYAMGLIYWWARAAARLPRLVNFLGKAPLVGGLIKLAGGISRKRKLPAFATQTFRGWFASRPAPRGSGPDVLLWPDTFNNFFHPRIARAAVEVLEHFGFRVRIPPRILCCGRPLYDWGMLDRAKVLLRQILDVLRDDIRAGVPLVGLEPSCLVTFRDELKGMFPADEDSKRLQGQSWLLSEFLMARVPEAALPRLTGRALVHLHCHHAAVLKGHDEKELLERLGLEVEVLDSGCCGMAGSFGFEADKYDVSMACGERVLLPRVHKAAHDTLIVTNGFSCREQILQSTEREPLHLAEVLRMALQQQQQRQQQGGAEPATPRPFEEALAGQRAPRPDAEPLAPLPAPLPGKESKGT